ncbi:MAG: rhodanese-like domain-containing protein [Phycisphaerae bacterium]|nr:rhodanese-like domain-containing protein [Phycisphaerae bacterium]
MKAIASTISQMIILCVLGLVVGLSVNAVRGKDHINLWRDYTPKINDGNTGGTEADEPQQPAEPAKERPFQILVLDQVIEIFEDDKTAYGLHVFVDARADTPYQAGRIPGAVQCDYYRMDFYVGSVLEYAAGAEKVIVYCNGGECEDSLYVCGELLNAEVPWGNIYFFKGGWEDWERSGQPIETGPKE